MFELSCNMFNNFAQRREDKTRRRTRSRECWSVTHSWVDENTELTPSASNHLKCAHGKKLLVKLVGQDGLNAYRMKGVRSPV